MLEEDRSSIFAGEDGGGAEGGVGSKIVGGSLGAPRSLENERTLAIAGLQPISVQAGLAIAAGRKLFWI